MIEDLWHFNFLDIRWIPHPRLFNDHFFFVSIVSFYYIDVATRILFFGDAFLSLFDIRLWFQMRNIQNDLVVDRHGNILPLAIIAGGKC